MEGVDAFTHDWEGEINWCSLPWVLLPRLTRCLYDRHKAEGVRLDVEWPHVIWFAPLNRLATKSILIPHQDELFIPSPPGMET